MTEDRIRDYIIEGMLGRGGMGSVYLARHIHLETKAALKVLLDQFSDNASIKARFINEAKLLHDLQHPNIVQQKEFFEDAGRLVLAMEYVDGRPLDKMIGQDVGPIPWEKALPLFTQILDGIGYAHSKGIVHRDIKPANILISKEGQVKVTDLGIAKIAGEQGMTRTGAQMGTLYYESPEQIKGAKDVDHRSDIYSLGMTLYEMLAGRLPFEKGGEISEFEIMSSIVNRSDHLDPRDHYPHIPEWLVKTIQQATELDPERRFQTCKIFNEAIRQHGEAAISQSRYWSDKVESAKPISFKKFKIISTEISSTRLKENSCPECKASVEKEMEFCGECGATLQKICPDCQTSIRWHRKFCPKCGIDTKKTRAEIQSIRTQDRLIIEEKRKEYEAELELQRFKYDAEMSKKTIRFSENSGIVSDKTTSLKWQVGPDNNTDWSAGEAWVKSLEGNWRMPSISELQELWDAGISESSWGFFKNSGFWVWAGDVQDLTSAWYLYFGSGGQGWRDQNYSVSGRAFAVRSISDTLIL